MRVLLVAIDFDGSACRQPLGPLPRLGWRVGLHDGRQARKVVVAKIIAEETCYFISTSAVDACQRTKTILALVSLACRGYEDFGEICSGIFGVTHARGQRQNGQEHGR